MSTGSHTLRLQASESAFPKGCYRMTGPGTAEYEPLAPRAKRAPSAYNRFVREQMLTYQFPAHFDQKQKMREIVMSFRCVRIERDSAAVTFFSSCAISLGF